MQTRRRLPKVTHTRDRQLMIISGAIAGFIIMTQVFGELMIRLDRFQHIGTTFCLFFFFYLVFAELGKKSLSGAILAALTIGFIKELGDPQFQQLDIASNFLGVFLALCCFFGFYFLNQRHSEVRTKAKL